MNSTKESQMQDWMLKTPTDMTEIELGAYISHLRELMEMSDAGSEEWLNLRLEARSAVTTLYDRLEAVAREQLDRRVALLTLGR